MFARRFSVALFSVALVAVFAVKTLFAMPENPQNCVPAHEVDAPCTIPGAGTTMGSYMESGQCKSNPGGGLSCFSDGPYTYSFSVKIGNTTYNLSHEYYDCYTSSCR